MAVLATAHELNIYFDKRGTTSMFNTLRFGDVQQTLDHLRQTMDQFFGYPAWTGDTRESMFSPAVKPVGMLMR